jgi:hypothetical protein
MDKLSKFNMIATCTGSDGAPMEVLDHRIAEFGETARRDFIEWLMEMHGASVSKIEVISVEEYIKTPFEEM